MVVRHLSTPCAFARGVHPRLRWRIPVNTCRRHTHQCRATDNADKRPRPPPSAARSTRAPRKRCLTQRIAGWPWRLGASHSATVRAASAMSNSFLSCLSNHEFNPAIDGGRRTHMSGSLLARPADGQDAARLRHCHLVCKRPFLSFGKGNRRPRSARVRDVADGRTRPSPVNRPLSNEPLCGDRDSTKLESTLGVRSPRRWTC